MRFVALTLSLTFFCSTAFSADLLSSAIKCQKDLNSAVSIFNKVAERIGNQDVQNLITTGDSKEFAKAIAQMWPMTKMSLADSLHRVLKKNRRKIYGVSYACRKKDSCGALQNAGPAGKKLVSQCGHLVSLRERIKDYLKGSPYKEPKVVAIGKTIEVLKGTKGLEAVADEQGPILIASLENQMVQPPVEVAEQSRSVGDAEATGGSSQQALVSASPVMALPKIPARTQPPKSPRKLPVRTKTPKKVASRGTPRPVRIGGYTLRHGSPSASGSGTVAIAAQESAEVISNY